MLAVFFISNLFSKLTVSYSAINKENIFPVFLLILLLGLLPENLSRLNLRIWACAVLFLSYYFIAVTYKKEKVQTELFKSGMMAMLMVYMDPLYLAYVIFILLAYFSFRVFQINELLSLFSGMFFLGLTLEFFIYLSDFVSFYPFKFWAEYGNYFGVPLIFKDRFIFFSLLFFSLNFSIFYLGFRPSGISVFMSKHRQMMIYWAFLSIIPFFVRCHSWEYVFLPAVIPFCFMVGESIFYIENKKVKALLFYLLVAGILGNFLLSKLK
ncbi:MAG: hypothetical protein N3F09_04960 [Bacteroidia bacterium]|nr:hypothetical protein [Bacteroidia bacterium]